MSWLSTVGGILNCVSSGLKIAQSFKTESASYVSGSGHGAGFWHFVSYSVVSNLDCPLQNIENYVENRILPRLTQHAPTLTDEQANDMKQVVEDYFYVMGWLVGDTDIAVSSCSYITEEGQMFLYLYNFHRDTNKYGELVTVSSMYTRTDYEIAKDWIMMTTITQSMFRGKQATELKYTDPSLTPEKLIEVYAIAFAPISLGLIRAPQNFLNTIEDCISKAAASGDLPSECSDAVKDYTKELYQQMVDRQEKRDATATEAIKELGSDIASLQ